MSFFPFENFYIITNLKPEEIQQRLEKEVEPDRGFIFKTLFSSGLGAYFSGYIVNGKFEFKRLLNYRNSFLPIIKGTIEPYLSGSRVHVKMTMQTAVFAFMCIWLGMVVLFWLGAMIQNYSKSTFLPAALMPLFMFLFGYALATGSFKYESVEAKNKLLELLKGEIEK